MHDVCVKRTEENIKEDDRQRVMKVNSTEKN